MNTENFKMKTKTTNRNKIALMVGLFAVLSGMTIAESAHAGGRLCGWAIKDMGPVTTTAPKNDGGVFSEGTEEGLSAQDRSRISDWALNTKLALEEITVKIASLKMVEKKQMLLECIENAVVDSAPLASETLLRYTLNRAMAANKVIEDEAVRKNYPSFAAGTVDQQVRLLRESVELALEYYQNDVMYINGKKASNKLRDLIAPEYARFGTRYNDLLLTLSNSIFDATAQYSILRKSIGWYANDLAKDAKAEAYGRIAINLDNIWRTLPDPSSYAMTDTAAVIHSRTAKRELGQAKSAYASVNQALEPSATKPTRRN
jgi:hypothetical protein